MKLWSKNATGFEKRARGGITAEVIAALVGLFMIIAPGLAVTLTVYILAIGLCVIGVLRIISYFRGDLKVGIMGMGLSVGLAFLTGGIVLLIFPLIPTYALFFILGALLLAAGFAKIQMALDVKRVGDGRWWVMLIAACVSLIMGILTLFNPFGVAVALIRAIGVFLIVESVVDIYCIVDFRKKVNDLFIEQ